MRVVSGTRKGHRLKAPPGASVRPTSDRVREAIFSILGDVEGRLVLDLFAGSGALGIEALSRGAAGATFVDSNARSMQTVEANLAALKLGDVRVERQSASTFLRRAASAGETWDLIFCDPPYGLAGRLGSELGILLTPVLAPGATIVCESSRREPLDLDLEVVTERTYGDTRVTIYSHA